MAELINQALFHVDVVDSRVSEGQYHLLSLKTEIFLLAVREGIIKPGMKITMYMWPEPALETCAEGLRPKFKGLTSAMGLILVDGEFNRHATVGAREQQLRRFVMEMVRAAETL